MIYNKKTIFRKRKKGKESVEPINSIFANDWVTGLIFWYRRPHWRGGMRGWESGGSGLSAHRRRGVQHLKPSSGAWFRRTTGCRSRIWVQGTMLQWRGVGFWCWWCWLGYQFFNVCGGRVLGTKHENRTVGARFRARWYIHNVYMIGIWSIQTPQINQYKMCEVWVNPSYRQSLCAMRQCEVRDAMR